MTTDPLAWRDHAACHGLTRLFFPELGEHADEAKRVCAHDEVVAEAHRVTPGIGIMRGWVSAMSQATCASRWVWRTETTLRLLGTTEWRYLDEEEVAPW